MTHLIYENIISRRKLSQNSTLIRRQMYLHIKDNSPVFESIKILSKSLSFLKSIFFWKLMII